MVLCITHSQDQYTIDIVQQHLKKLGIDSFRFNSDQFATAYHFNYSLHGCINDLCWSANNTTLYASQITGVWYRKLWKLQVPEELDPDYTFIFEKEYKTHLHIFFEALYSLPWINKIDSDHAAGGNKFHQLMVAKHCGLTIPKTILTNSQAAVLDFYEVCKGNIVMKLHGALSKSMKRDGAFFPTTFLSQHDLPQLDTLPYCPMIFQEQITKLYELRIVYIDGAFYTGKINTQHTQKGKIDWRTTTTRIAPWEPYVLPTTVEEKIDSMMRQMDLSFGAIDMIKQPNGEYTFLEVNPQGEWGMLQRDLGYPIGETIAEKLIKRIKNG